MCIFCVVFVEVLKVELLEIATGKRGGKFVALVDVRKACFYASSWRKVFWTCRQKIARQVMNTCAREEELASTLSDLKLTRGIRCPCVLQGCIKGNHMVATVHGDDITIGGERSVVELLINMTSRKYEIKKQAIGEDPDLEKSARILNRCHQVRSRRDHERGGSETMSGRY